MKLDYDEISPITGNRSVLVEVENDSVFRFCVESGYCHYSNVAPVEFESTCPEHLRDTKFFAGDAGIWYKITLNQGDVMLYPDVYDGDNVWYVGKWRGLHIDEQLNDRMMFRYEKNIAGEQVPYVFDTDLASIFEEEEFPQAYNHFNKLCNETND